MTISLDSVTISPSITPRPAVAQCAPPLAATTLRAAVDLAAVAHNGRRLAQVAGVLWMAVVKADACGHGLGSVVLATLSAGASWLEMAQLAEALTLRALLDEIGVSYPVGESTSQAPQLLTWLLSVTGPDRVAAEDSPLRAVLAADLDLSVSTLSQPKALSVVARAQGRVARLHLKVDTGMSHGDATAEELPALAAALRRAEDEGTVDVVGPQSCLSCTNEPASGSTEEHLERYRQAEQVVLAAGLNPPTHYLVATGGLPRYPQACMDLVRAGTGICGLSLDPSVVTGVELGLRPVMRPGSLLVQVKRIEAGQTVSYGGIWSAPTDRWVGFAPPDYSDGVPCAASSAGPVGVGSLMTSVVGRARMDRVIIDLGPAVDETGVSLPAAVRVGDTAMLWGAPVVSDQEAVPTADEWAQVCGTIDYEIVTRSGARVPRCYVGESGTGDYSRS